MTDAFRQLRDWAVKSERGAREYPIIVWPPRPPSSFRDKIVRDQGSDLDVRGG